MRNIYRILLMLWGLYVPLHSHAQQYITPLAIGDTLPRLPFHQVIQYESDSLQLSDFRGKLLILDFWNTWCAACLASFPKLTELQQKYGDRIRILPVVSSREGSRQKYLDFYNMRKGMGLPIALPSIVEDSILSRLFPHRSLPHVVWIGADGGIRGITDGKELKEENIQKMLTSDGFALPHRDSTTMRYMDYSIKHPLSITGRAGLVRQSVLAHNLPIKYSHNLHISRDSLYTRITFVGTRLPYLFVQLFEKRYPRDFVGKASRYVQKHIFCETTSEPMASAIALHNDRDPRKYADAGEDFYTYELLLAGAVSDAEILDAMLADLGTILGVEARLEKRKVMVLEVFVKDEKKIPRTVYSDAREYEQYTALEDRQRYVCTNKKISVVVNSLNTRSEIPFLWDMTGLDVGVDLDLVWDKKDDVGNFRRELEKNGLGIRQRKEKLSVLVIR